MSSFWDYNWYEELLISGRCLLYDNDQHNSTLSDHSLTHSLPSQFLENNTQKAHTHREAFIYTCTCTCMSTHLNDSQMLSYHIAHTHIHLHINSFIHAHIHTPTHSHTHSFTEPTHSHTPNTIYGHKVCMCVVLSFCCMTLGVSVCVHIW